MHLEKSFLSFDANWMTWVVIALSALAVAIALIRRPSAPALTLALFAAGLVALSLAAANPVWRRPSAQQVTVMVDLSPSTRTAQYRDRAGLERRIHELLRDVQYRVEYFADGTRPIDGSLKRLPDLPADRTTYGPPAAAAVLLFSDCRFALPEQSPPTYVCVDVGLDDPPDAAISKLEIRGNDAAISVANAGSPRRLAFEGTTPALPTTLPSGSQVIARPLASGASQISVELSPGDAWPENDAMHVTVPPPQQLERWWVGGSSPNNAWRAIDPANLPTDSAAYLNAGVIVLDNVAASQWTDLQQRRLQQYVRDLGGGLVILGGDHAFAAGGYDGTPLDNLSPLASSPPLPTTHWVLLADGSGSMSEAVPGGTRWKHVTDAITATLPHLPPEDVASVGSFAETLHWWVEGKPAREAATTPLPPADAYPHGPTNLQPALESIARSTDGKMPVQLLVLSDLDTQVTDAPRLSELLNSRNVHLHLLAIGEGTALPILRQVAVATGGSVLTQLDPSRWAEATRELARAAGPKLRRQDSILVSFQGPAATIAPQTVDRWNRVWIKPRTEGLASASLEGQTVPMAAEWNSGEGRVVAAAFAPDPGGIDALVKLAARPPRDPRFRVSWETGAQVRVSIDAIDGGQYVNRQTLMLNLGAASQPIPQTGPGRYELEIDAPRASTIATVRVAGRVLERIAIAGRYAPEFDSIGNDYSAMRELALRSGGAVIPPDQSKAIDVHWPVREVQLTSEVAIGGAFCVAMGLIAWRRSG